MAKEIELTKGYKAIVDDDMFDILNQYRWCAQKDRRSKTVYAARSIKIHHLVVGFPPPGSVVDHINGNGLDNRRENLRIVSNQQNIHCQSKNRNNTSGYRGVSWHKAKQRWEASIRVNNQRLHLGRYKTIEEAAHAYDEAAKRYFKEFAKLNFPE